MYEMEFAPGLQWEVTPNCNHNCTHCYNYWRENSDILDPMSKDIAKYIEVAKAIVKNNPVSVGITGGEPLLVFKEIKPAIEYLQQNNITVSINTNAALMTEEIAEYLSTHNIGLFISFPCSDPFICDKITNTPDSHRKIVSGIKILDKYNINYSVNMVVSKMNKDYVFSTAKYIKNNFNCSSFHATRVGKPMNASEDFNKYLLSNQDIEILMRTLVRIKTDLQMESGSACAYPYCSFPDKETYDLLASRKICVAGKTFYVVCCNGDVKACTRESETYGNILTEDFSKIWERMKFWRNGSLLPKECKDCSNKGLCIGGCRMDALSSTGKLNGLDSLANLENYSIQFSPKVKPNMDYSQVFILNPKVIILKDNKAYRLSVGRSFIYITEDLYIYLANHDIYSINEFINLYNIEGTIAENVFRWLLNANILQKGEGFDGTVYNSRHIFR